MQYIKTPHIITEQYIAEQQILAHVAAENPTWEKPFIKVNPYLIAPLTALVCFTTEKAQKVSICVKGKEKNGNVHFTFPEATQHFLPIYGLYSGQNTEVEITLDDGKKQKHLLTTQAAPQNLVAPTKIETTAAYMGNLVMFVTPSSPAATAAYDYRGDVRWYCTLNLCFDLKRAKNGRLLVGSERLFLPPYHTTGLFEMGMIGKIYKEYRLPGGYHHDQLEMEDGNLLILSQDPSMGTVEDMCVLVDRNTGDIIKRWDYKEILPQNEGGSDMQDQYDWFHNNSVWYDKKTNSLTLSGRHQDIIINIDYDSHKLRWILGNPDTWPQEMVDKYFFTVVGDTKNFDWSYAQHAAMILPDGDVMCFDNGLRRAKRKEDYVPAKHNFSRGVRYRIDTEKMEIEQIWQYGKERGEHYYSTYISNVEYYGEGHYMVHSGGAGRFKGHTCERPPVFHMGPEGHHIEFDSFTTEIQNDTVVYEMHLPANYYRAEKLPLYCQEDTLSFGKGQLLGTLGITESFDTIPELASGNTVPEKNKLHCIQEEDRLVLKGNFEKGQMVMLILEGKTTHAYFVPTTKRPFLAMCVGTFLDVDERAVEFPISTEGLSGNFKVRIIIDETDYDTGISLSI